MPPHTPIIKGFDQGGATRDDVYLHGPRGTNTGSVQAAAVSPSDAAADGGPAAFDLTTTPLSAPDGLHGEGWIV